ncbi:MAG: flavin reductase family protein [bacterium]
MGKISLKPSTLLFPVPTVLVTCQGRDGKPNIITLAWVGVVCSDPPMIGIGVRPSRHSHGLIVETGEFVVNIPREEHLRQTDFCGVVSGRSVDKFAATGLTPTPAKRVKPPLILECPVNLECLLRQRIGLGSHDLLIGEVVEVHADGSVVEEDGKLNIDALRPIAFCPGAREVYRSLGRGIGRFGFTKGKL